MYASGRNAGDSGAVSAATELWEDTDERREVERRFLVSIITSDLR